jgi:RecB family exonuclease
VWVSPDVIMRDSQDQLLIVDWKTGVSTQKQETVRQLAVYGIYALRTYGASTEQLVGVEENLRLGEDHVYNLKEWALEEARQYIEGSIERMGRLLHDRERNIALIRDFPMTDHLAACLDCRFRRACDRG